MINKNIEKLKPRDLALIALAEKKGNNADLILLDEIFKLAELIDSNKDKFNELSLKLENISIKKESPAKNGHTPTDDELLAIIRPLIPAPAKNGHTPTDDELLAIIRPLIPAPAKNGKDANEKLIVEKLTELIPTTEKILDYLPKYGTAVRDSLELLTGKERLKPTAIEGWEDLQQQLVEAQKKGTPIRFSGATRGFFVYIGGVKKGIINTLDFVAGSGMAIAYSKVNGRDTLTFTSSGGGAGGITVETPPETPDASIVDFTVSAQPKWVVADGTTYYSESGYTYNSGTEKVTMSIAPSSFIRAII